MSTFADAAIALGIVGEVAFGRLDGKIQTELRRRSNDKLGEATDRLKQVEFESGFFQESAAKANERAADALATAETAKSETAKTTAIAASAHERAAALENETEQLRAENLRMHLIISPRFITDEQRSIISERVAGKVTDLKVTMIPGLEPLQYGWSLFTALTSSPGVKGELARFPWQFVNANFIGIFVFTDGPNRKVISDALHAAGVPFFVAPSEPPSWDGLFSGIDIMVGLKPIPGFVDAPSQYTPADAS